MINEKDRLRFFSKIQKQDNGCELYNRGLYPNGYGKFYCNGKNRLAHRVAAEIYFGDIPKGMMVLHKCDVKKCCAKEHLFFGTQTNNMRDMIKKGRQVINKSMLGKHHSKEAKDKCRLANLGKIVSEETRKKMGEASSRRIISKETREKLRVLHTGSKRSEETLKKMRIAHKGIMHTEETKLKLSIAHTGKKLSAEHCKKIGDRTRGKKFSEEHKQKIGLARKGVKHSEEARLKMSENCKKAWEKRKQTFSYLELSDN